MFRTIFLFAISCLLLLSVAPRASRAIQAVQARVPVQARTPTPVTCLRPRAPQLRQPKVGWSAVLVDRRQGRRLPLHCRRSAARLEVLEVLGPRKQACSRPADAERGLHELELQTNGGKDLLDPTTTAADIKEAALDITYSVDTKVASGWGLTIEKPRVGARCEVHVLEYRRQSQLPLRRRGHGEGRQQRQRRRHAEAGLRSQRLARREVAALPSGAAGRVAAVCQTRDHCGNPRPHR